LIPLDAPTDPIYTVPGITKTHVKSLKTEGRLGLGKIIAAKPRLLGHLSRFAANSFNENNAQGPKDYSLI
jgi:hypothetical protein